MGIVLAALQECVACAAGGATPEPPDIAKSLELLFNYTTFHIGAYMTLTGLYITLVKSSADWVPKIRKWVARLALAGFVGAGIGGGMVASNIPDSGCHTALDYMGHTLRFWCLDTLTAQMWIHIEHSTFWVGIFAAVSSFQWPVPAVPPPNGRPLRPD